MNALIFGPAIPPFAEAEQPPPRSLGRFLGWAVKGAWPAVAPVAVVPSPKFHE